MAILGIDEVGRGPLAGPLVVGAVILPGRVDGRKSLLGYVDDRKSGGLDIGEKASAGGALDIGEKASVGGACPEWVEELKDSKKLSAKKRERLSGLILAEAPAVGLGWVSAAELDEVGISEALRLATRRAVEQVQECGVPFSQIVIDGKVNFLAGTALEKYVSTAVKADALVREVSAASIVAKVARDRYMVEVAERYPGYGFEKHVGYGTAAHLEAITRLGPSPVHRKSFEPVKSMVGFKVPQAYFTVVKNTTVVGGKGEDAVCEYLVCEGHEVVARNFKTYLYEIDIISVKDGRIYFTEVKYRASDVAGGGLVAITREKLAQMRFAAECFLMFRRDLAKQYDPLLAVAEVTGEDFEVREWMPLTR